MPIPHCLGYYSFALKFKKSDSPKFVLFPGNFDYSRSLAFLHEFLCKNFGKKKITWGFNGDCVDSTDQFGEYCHFSPPFHLSSPFCTAISTIFSPLIYEHRMSSRIFMSHLILSKMFSSFHFKSLTPSLNTFLSILLLSENSF